MILTRKEALIKEKHGIKISVYPTKSNKAGFVYVEVEEGHFQEFYDKKSTFIYYILEGKGTFYLDGKETEVEATDLVVIPPMTKIYYFGKMKMTLTTVPAWQTENEVEVRLIEKQKK